MALYVIARMGLPRKRQSSGPITPVTGIFWPLSHRRLVDFLWSQLGSFTADNHANLLSSFFQSAKLERMVNFWASKARLLAARAGIGRIDPDNPVEDGWTRLANQSRP